MTHETRLLNEHSDRIGPWHRAALLVFVLSQTLTLGVARAQDSIPQRLGAEVLTQERPQVPLWPAAAASARSLAAAVPREGIAWYDAVFDDVVAVGTDSGWHCSGVLIDRRLVLTARHCLPATRVLFGADIRRPLLLRAVHAVQTPLDRSLDAALLLLDAAVDLPLAARRSARDATPPSGFLRAVGFGSTNRFVNSSYGRKRFVETFTTGWSCEAQSSGESRCDKDSELRLTGGANRDTCNGDSGGPLFEQVRDQRRLVAITSRAAVLGQGGCGGGGIYVRVDRLDDWLQRAIAQLVQTPHEPTAQK